MFQIGHGQWCRTHIGTEGQWIPLRHKEDGTGRRNMRWSYKLTQGEIGPASLMIMLFSGDAIADKLSWRGRSKRRRRATIISPRSATTSYRSGFQLSAHLSKSCRRRCCQHSRFPRTGPSSQHLSNVINYKLRIWQHNTREQGDIMLAHNDKNVSLSCVWV